MTLRRVVLINQYKDILVEFQEWTKHKFEPIYYIWVKKHQLNLELMKSISEWMSEQNIELEGLMISE